MFEKEAEEYVSKYQGYGWQPHRGSATFEAMLNCYIDGAEFGYNKAKKGNKTSYIKGMRHLANALKEYDRNFGAWTDYFEHTVDKVLKQELEKE